MMLSDDAQMLWEAAQSLKEAKGLAGAADAVSAPMRARGRDLPPLLFFTDPVRVPRPWETAARMPPGSAVIYRHFGAAGSRAVAERLRAITRANGIALLIGLDVDLADQVGADGVHLPERALSAAYALGGKRPGWLITAAVHSTKAAAAARDVDALVLSPIFPAGGASAAKPALGLETLRQTVLQASSPVYALGGIGPNNVGALAETGACGFAAVQAISSAFGEPRI